MQAVYVVKHFEGQTSVYPSHGGALSTSMAFDIFHFAELVIMVPGQDEPYKVIKSRDTDGDCDVEELARLGCLALAIYATVDAV